MRYLRNNTAVIVTVGPFLDKTDGVTEETGLTVTNCHLVMYKDDDDGTAVNSIIDTTCTASGGDNDLVHIAHGMYSLELTQAQTNYLGRVLLQISDAANHCPVFHEFVILPAQVYDSLILGTDLLQIDVENIDNDATAAANLNSACDNYSATRGLAGTALPNAAADAAGGLPVSDAGGLDMDSIKADTAAILVDTGTDGVVLADDAITAAKFDESTAFPLAAADSGSTAVARAGADADTLETLSDQLDGMSGSGFLSSTDSLEAIRNRGDIAWTTGAGIAATDAYAPSGAPVVTTGAVSSGAYTDLAAVDGALLVVDEASTTNPGMDFYVPIMTAAGKKGVAVKMWGYYSGNASHFIRVQASVDGSTTVFEDIGTIANGTGVTPYEFGLSSQHINANGEFNLRFLHNAVGGVGTHKLHIDKLIAETVDAVQAVVLADGAHGGASASITLGDTDVETALDAASAAGDPWSTALPGAYGAGTAGKIVGDRLVVLGDEAHGGAAATFVTAAGVLAQESTVGTIEQYSYNIGRFNAIAQGVMEVYLSAKGWDWTSDPIVSVAFDGTLSGGDGIHLDLLWWRGSDATLQSVELGNLANDGSTWTPHAGLAAALAAVAPPPMGNDVSCTIGAWTQSGQQIGAGTLTLVVATVVGTTPLTIPLDIPEIRQDTNHIYWDRSGACLLEPLPVPSAGTVDNAAIAAAVRDVSNATPAPGSLGAGVAAAAGGGGGSPSGAKFFTTED